MALFGSRAMSELSPRWAAKPTSDRVSKPRIARLVKARLRLGRASNQKLNSCNIEAACPTAAAASISESNQLDGFKDRRLVVLSRPMERANAGGYSRKLLAFIIEDFDPAPLPTASRAALRKPHRPEVTVI
jgi:hypothetical protein